MIGFVVTLLLITNVILIVSNVMLRRALTLRTRALNAALDREKAAYWAQLLERASDQDLLDRLRSIPK